MSCKCKVCTRYYHFVLVLSRVERAEDRKFLLELLSDLDNAETDADYYKDKLNGTWPGDHISEKK